MSLDMEIYSNLSLVSLYSRQITSYRSLYVYQQLILEFIKATIWEISYLDSLLIITGVEASCVLLEKALDVAG